MAKLFANLSTIVGERRHEKVGRMNTFLVAQIEQKQKTISQCHEWVNRSMKASARNRLVISNKSIVSLQMNYLIVAISSHNRFSGSRSQINLICNVSPSSGKSLHHQSKQQAMGKAIR